jgi:hypothetical protein
MCIIRILKEMVHNSYVYNFPTLNFYVTEGRTLYLLVLVLLVFLVTFFFDWIETNGTNSCYIN